MVLKTQDSWVHEAVDYEYLVKEVGIYSFTQQEKDIC